MGRRRREGEGWVRRFFLLIKQGIFVSLVHFIHSSYGHSERKVLNKVRS